MFHERVITVECNNKHERVKKVESTIALERVIEVERTKVPERITAHESTIYSECPNWLDRFLTDRAMKKHNRRTFQLNCAITTIGQYENKQSQNNP